MIPGRISLMEVRTSCRLVSSNMFQNYVGDAAVLGECFPPGCDSSLNFLVLFVLSLLLYLCPRSM